MRVALHELHWYTGALIPRAITKATTVKREHLFDASFSQLD
jgi:hypothetical protein